MNDETSPALEVELNAGLGRASITPKELFWKEWGVDGMPKDKQRLAEAAWEDATKAEREFCAALAVKIIGSSNAKVEPPLRNIGDNHE